VRRAETSKAELARNMVGREVVLRICKDENTCGDRAVLEVDDLTVQHGAEKALLSQVSFCVQAGEILAVAGVDGNGQRELIEVVSGLRKPTRGSVRVQGQDVVRLGARGLTRLGVARIPEDRQALGLVMDFTVQENLVVDSYDRPPNSRFAFLNRRAMRASAARLCEEYDVRPRRPDLRTRLLSGGNQQKVILARELSREPGFILAAQPTRGLDVGATEYVYRCLLEQRTRGAGILLVSTELDEILTLADRVAVIYEGRIMGILEREQADVAHIGMMMAGATLADLGCAGGT
jgi:simple sugar transport system ATP-binding protein